ncbi:hypothetical protein QTI66_30200 [Variovorax sp. J22R133]|uniref:hypothetical protein n=1 Tax=Variovorax brevis TaxID=3053503 RepID=UPI0025758901|nr:hypothetical protein [Variovorax sp. J22R133]MDM0116423.1 hypothetical protein [Variovorax sp. J22R133]
MNNPSNTLSAPEPQRCRGILAMRWYGAMFGILVADNTPRQKTERLAGRPLLSAKGSLRFEGGWNKKALIALAPPRARSTGPSLARASGLMFNGGDWGWLVGAGAILHAAVNRVGMPTMAAYARA